MLNQRFNLEIFNNYHYFTYRHPQLSNSYSNQLKCVINPAKNTTAVVTQPEIECQLAFQ